jgi:hypothetical protein
MFVFQRSRDASCIKDRLLLNAARRIQMLFPYYTNKLNILNRCLCRTYGDTTIGRVKTCTQNVCSSYAKRMSNIWNKLCKGRAA